MSCLRNPFKAIALVTLTTLAMGHSAFAQYCSFVYRSYTTCVGGNITNVTFGGINHTVPCMSGGGYRDLTTSVTAANLQKGQSYPISVTVGGASWLGGTSVWIDFDKNGVFDPAEMVFNSTYDGIKTTHTGTVNIPQSVTGGTTTMRVVGTESGSPSGPCGSSIQWGEAQDYTVTISGDGYNNAGISAIVSPVNLAFCDGSQDIKVRVSNKGKNILNTVTIDWELDGLTQSSIFWNHPLDTVGGASPSDTVITVGSAVFAGGTPRSVKVWTSYPNGMIDTTRTDDTIHLSIRSRVNCASLPSYCTPTFTSWTSCIGGAVASVSLGSFSHSTPCRIGGGYRNMSDTVPAAVVYPGEVVPVSMRIGSSYPTGGGGAMWMDFNRNGLFEASEQVFTGTYNSANGTPYTYTGTITIPANTTQGYVKMRVIGQEGGNPTNACAGSYGEGNDYLVLVTAGSPNNAAVTQIEPATQSFCAGQQDIKARIRNTGSAVLNYVTVEWSVDGMMQAPFYWFSPLDTIGGSQVNDTLLTLGQVLFSAGAEREIKVWTSMPNGVQDTTNADDSLLVRIEPSVVGACANFTLPTYCTPPFLPWSSSCVGGNITNVTFAGINKNTTCTPGGNYYMNYTSSVSPARVSPGKSYPISVFVGGASYTGGCAAWIDFNKNGTFEASEYVFSAAPTGLQQAFTGTVSIPFYAQEGYTVMRVIGLENQTPLPGNACTPGGYGEAQDYVVEIGNRPSNNAATLARIAPFTFCPGAHDIRVRIANRGKNPINTVLVEWTLDGMMQAPVTWNSVIDTFGGTGPSDTVITIGNVFFTAGVAQTVKVWTSYPNSMIDTTTTDDTISFVLKPAISGSFTIGAGGTYPDFTAAASELNNVGICGTVIFDIAAGAVFNEVPVAFINLGNGTDSIVFRKDGPGANPVINCTGTAAGSEAAIDIRGGLNMVFDGIDIRTSGTLLEYGYRLTNTAGRGSSNNIIRNSRIVLNRSNGISTGIMQTSNNVLGGGITATSYAGSNHNNTYKNICVENAFSGIALIGAYSFPDTNCVVTSEGADTTIIGAASANDIGNTSGPVYGIYFNNIRNGEISNCVVRNVTQTSNGTAHGIFVENTSSGQYENVNVFNNTVHNIDRSGTTTSTSSHVHGIRVDLSLSSSAHVFNNVIYNITSTGNTGSPNSGLAVRGLSFGTSSGAGTLYAYNNSVQINNPSVNHSSAAFWRNGGGQAILTNNIFSNVSAAQSGAAKHYSVYAASGSVTASNNLLWIQNTNGFVGYLGADQSTMSDWRTASSQDIRSLFHRPGFTSPTNLLPNPLDNACWSMNGRGVHHPELAFDRNGASRAAVPAAGTPDIGAYEFTPAVAPPVAVGVPAIPAAGTTQTFFFAEDTVARIEWASFAAVPPSVTVRLYSGETNAPLTLSANQVLNSYWDISMAPGSYNYTAYLHYKDIWKGSIQDLFFLRGAKKPVPGYWSIDPMSITDTLSGIIAMHGSTEPAMLATGAYQYDPLPVKLTRFAGHRQNDDALLTWSTASEVNSRGFAVERSADGKTWEEAGFERAKGAGRYFFNDRGIMKNAGRMTYRLRMVDLDGSFGYSDVIVISSTRTESHRAEVYPNPFTGRVSVEVVSQEPADAGISISDISGKTLSSQVFRLDAGINILNPETGSLNPGIYFITITSGTHTTVKKVVKQ